MLFDNLPIAFDEALEVIVKAWTTRERFSHDGRFWRFKNVGVELPPKQAPHPALWTGAGSPASIQRAAERGHNLILDQFASAEMLCERIARESVRSSPWSIFVAPTPDRESSAAQRTSIDK